MIVLLVLVDLIIIGMVVSGARGHDLTVRRVDTVQAFYTAEAGMNMAIREMMINTDEDGDCRVGSISHDGDDTNDPIFASAQVVVTSAASGPEMSLSSQGRSGGARRRMEAVLDVLAGGTVTREETVTAAQIGGTPVTMPPIGGGTNQTYVLFIATRQNHDVTSVAGGGLSWVEQIEQCAGRDQQGIRMWTAQGSPGSSFQASITWAVDADPIVAILSRYSGAATLEDATGENTNGESGACSGGVDNDPTQLTLTSTVNGSVHVIGVNSRNDPIASYTSGYTEITTDQAGSGGELTILTMYDKSFDPASTEQFQGTTNGTNDWATAGIVLNP
jgi:hypothetical protein